MTISIIIGDYSPKKSRSAWHAAISAPYKPQCCMAPVERLCKVNGASLRWHYPGQVLRVVTTVTASHGHSQHHTPLAVWLNIADPPYICKPALTCIMELMPLAPRRLGLGQIEE